MTECTNHNKGIASCHGDVVVEQANRTIGASLGRAEGEEDGDVKYRGTRRVGAASNELGGVLPLQVMSNSLYIVM
jgi:hypothetical protein